MRLNNFIEGLMVLRPYYHDPDGHHIRTEQDRFFAYATDHPLREPDFVKMLGLGWFQMTIAGVPGGVSYQPAEGWSCFT
jgi:hypothetical protein